MVLPRMLFQSLTVGNNVLMAINKTGTTDVRGYENMIPNDNNVSKSEASHARKTEIIAMHEIYNIPKTRTHPGKASCANKARGVQWVMIINITTHSFSLTPSYGQT